MGAEFPKSLFLCLWRVSFPWIPYALRRKVCALGAGCMCWVLHKMQQHADGPYGAMHSVLSDFGLPFALFADRVTLSRLGKWCLQHHTTCAVDATYSLLAVAMIGSHSSKHCTFDPLRVLQLFVIS